MRVLLADDEPKVRSALRLILEQLKEVDAIDEVADANSLTERLNANVDKPDLLLIDWELPGLPRGVSWNKLRHGAALKVVLLSGRCRTHREALASGANAFISKCEPPDRLFATLRALGAD